jgi:hypothetical protein
LTCRAVSVSIDSLIPRSSIHDPEAAFAVCSGHRDNIVPGRVPCRDAGAKHGDQAIALAGNNDAAY